MRSLYLKGVSGAINSLFRELIASSDRKCGAWLCVANENLIEDTD